MGWPCVFRGEGLRIKGLDVCVSGSQGAQQGGWSMFIGVGVGNKVGEGVYLQVCVCNKELGIVSGSRGAQQGWVLCFWG